MKHCMAACLREIYGQYEFYGESYYSMTHLPAFIGRFKERETKMQDNIWILKPINSARSMDHVITNKLDCIVRHVETAPRLIQKYISNPFLINKKKIDLRFWVIVRSFTPLEIYVHNYTYSRVSSSDYDSSETNLNDWSRHFGLSDRESGEYNSAIYKEELIESFNNHKEDGFKQFEEKTHKLIKDVFRASVLHKPEIHNKNVRAIYGIDIIPDADLVPHILECTFMPDLYYILNVRPTHLSEISRCMYFGEDTEMTRLY
jgi:hypothetical protein